MKNLPDVNFKTLSAVLKNMGFVEVGRKGEHVFYAHADGRMTSVPHYKGKNLPRALVRLILKDI